MIENIHERIIHAQVAEVGSLIDRLASRDDALWPSTRWPAMRFDRPLGVGAIGGHGPVRYFIEEYEPGRSITFRFTSPKGFIGTHGFEVKEVGPSEVQLRHVLKMRVAGMARFTWPLVFRWLHDALIEDALDRAESHCMSKPFSERTLSAWVRLLRHLMNSTAARVLLNRGANAAVQK